MPCETPQDRPRILVVEDNADVRAYLRDRLCANYNVVEARDGLEGLRLIRGDRPDLVIADVMMPAMDGYQLCWEIRHDPDLSHVPVILLTARADEADRLEGFQKGADAYLTKPFNSEELLLRVENLIELRSMLRQRFSDEVVIKPSEIVIPSEEAVFLDQARRIVEQKMSGRDFGVEMLSSEMALSRRQLQRKMQTLTGVSPAGFIRMMRLERAAQLLRQRYGRISEVADAVGFGSAEHFSRVFRQVFDESPSQFQERTSLEASTTSLEASTTSLEASTTSLEASRTSLEASRTSLDAFETDIKPSAATSVRRQSDTDLTNPDVRESSSR